MERNRMRRLAGVFAVVGLLMSPPVAGSAEPGKLVVVGSGGAVGEIINKVAVQPFASETGIRVTFVPMSPRLPKIKAMVDSGQVEWDVAETVGAEVLGNPQLFEAVAYEAFDKRDLAATPASARLAHGFGFIVFSTVMAYNEEHFRGNPPRSWADFWDVKRFPGPRGLSSLLDAWGAALEWALLADGVPMDKLYPLDVERGFRKLREIRPHVTKYWRAGAQGAQLLADREVVVSDIFHGRLESTRASGTPVVLQWNQHMLQLDFFSVVKGSANKANAMKFLAFLGRPEVQAEFAKALSWGPTNGRAFETLPAELGQKLPTHPEILKTGFFRDEGWWVAKGADGRTNREMVLERWNRFLLE